jgi:hypothetical protein
MKPDYVTMVRWIARVLALGLFLLWGAFFVVHLKAWFTDPFPKVPPPKVCFIVALHALFLIGLLAGWRWELAGSLIVLLGGGAFFWAASGRLFPVFFGVAALPAIGWLWTWWSAKPRFIPLRLF